MQEESVHDTVQTIITERSSRGENLTLSLWGPFIYLDVSLRPALWNPLFEGLSRLQIGMSYFGEIPSCLSYMVHLKELLMTKSIFTQVTLHSLILIPHSSLLNPQSAVLFLSSSSSNSSSVISECDSPDILDSDKPGIANRMSGKATAADEPNYLGTR
jgi:hypothetical protein